VSLCERYILGYQMTHGACIPKLEDTARKVIADEWSHFTPHSYNQYRPCYSLTYMFHDQYQG